MPGYSPGRASRHLLCILFLSTAYRSASFVAAPTKHAHVHCVKPVSLLPALFRGQLQPHTTLRPNSLIVPTTAAPVTVLSALSTDREVGTMAAPKDRGAVERGTRSMDVQLGSVNTDTLLRPGTSTQTRTREDSKQAREMEGERLDDLAMHAAKSADMGLRYDPVTAEKEFDARTLDVWKRDLQISVPLTVFLGQVLIDFQRGVEKENRPMRAKHFMEIIAGLGPAFIKAGQALSSRPDLLPPEYLEELQKLQDRLPPFPNDLAFKIIEEQLGVPMDEVFEFVEPEPVAAASIGQVYKGYLRTGEAVAIKVQRPECQDIIGLDIYILRELSGMLSQVIKLLRRDIDLRSIVEEFGKLIYEEIDYLQEARNAQRFLELYGNNPAVYVPRIYWRFCKSKLLVMEWIDGERLTSSTLSTEVKTKLVRAMTQCSLQQMLEKGFFHADPHGGNLLATPDGRLVYLDFGMMSEVEAYQRYGILEAVIHLVNRDFRSLCQLYVRLGFIPPGTDVEPIEIALAKALPDVLGASVDTLNIKNVIGELGDVMYKFPFNLPPYYTAIVRCLGVLEGLAIQVDGTFRIINDAYPYVASRVLSDPHLQDILQYMILTPDKAVRWNRLENLLESAATAGSAGVATWDMQRTAELFGDFILAERNRQVRDNIIDDLTDVLDNLGLETASYLSAVAADTARNVATQNPATRLLLPRGAGAAGGEVEGPQSVSQGQSTAPPLPPEAVRELVRRVSLLSTSPSISNLGLSSPQRAWPMLQELVLTTYDRPELQRLIFETATHLLERISSRAIRLAFAMPQPPARELPRLRTSSSHYPRDSRSSRGR